MFCLLKKEKYTMFMFHIPSLNSIREKPVILLMKKERVGITLQ